MECLVRLQKRPKFIDLIEKFQLSGAYPVFFAILCAVSGLGNKYVYLPIISILGLSILFSVLFVRDNKVFITPIFMIYYALGTDTPKAFLDSNGEVLAAFDYDGLIGICILAAIIAIPVFLRFILDGSFAYAIKNRGVTFWGIVALNVAIFLGGAFSKHWSPVNLAYALILVAGLDVFYLILSSIVRKSDGTVIPYACKILVITCLMIAAQAILLALQLHLDGMLIRVNEWTGQWILQREYLARSWGISTIICASCSVGIPAAMYMARNERFPLFYYISALVMWCVTILVNTRSAMLVGGIFLIVGIAIISFSGKNKKCNLIFSAILLVLLIAGVIVAYNKLTRTLTPNEIFYNLYKYLRFDSVNDRMTIFDVGVKDFLSAPIFGVGWVKGALSQDLQSNNFYSNMYHCIVIQMGASAGSVGLLALILHVKDYFRIAFKKPRTDRFLLLFIPASVLLMSLVDNFIFYLNLQIFYVAFLCIAEKHLELTQKKQK